MSNINPSSLFHFTKSLDILKLILSNGLRFSYCKEVFPGSLSPATSDDKFSWLERTMTDTYVGIPMICFCDISISRVEKHTESYGNYGMGFDKNKLAGDYNYKGVFELNPVWYIYSNSITSLFESLCNITGSIDKNKQNELYRVLGFCKPYDNRIASKYKGENYHCFYDENEWRIVFPNTEQSECPWFFSSKEQDFDSKLIEYNESFHASGNAYLCFWKYDKDNIAEVIDSFITHIIVNTENEVAEIAQYILDENHEIMGFQNLSSKDRAFLCTRIISMERIRKDY